MRYRIIAITVIVCAFFVFVTQHHSQPVQQLIYTPSLEDKSSPDTESTPLQTISPEHQTPLQAQNHQEPTILSTNETSPASVNVDMTYISEAPDGNWSGSWKNGCEEAAIAMVEYYYAGLRNPSIEDTKAFMQTLFDAQQAQYGSDANSNSERNLWMIENYTNFNAHIVENPTVSMIKDEIRAGRPVIALHHGFDLGNKNIPFLATGSSYHATVVTGYDDIYQEWIVHDTGDTHTGDGHRYHYDTYMNSLHDYSYDTQLADGPAVVLFTSP